MYVMCTEEWNLTEYLTISSADDVSSLKCGHILQARYLSCDSLEVNTRDVGTPALRQIISPPTGVLQRLAEPHYTIWS